MSAASRGQTPIHVSVYKQYFNGCPGDPRPGNPTIDIIDLDVVDLEPKSIPVVDGLNA